MGIYRIFKILIGYLSLVILVVIIQGCISTEPLQDKERVQQQVSNMSAENDTVTVDDTYKIRTGDEIEILAWEHPNFNTLTKVSSLGTISVPLIGEIEVSGLTRIELSRLLHRELAKYLRGDINITVSVRNTDSMLVSVFGRVTQPDNYPLVEGTSLIKVISSAGGTVEDANIRRIKIYRKNGNPNYTSVDLTQYLESGNMNSDRLLVYPGDIVYIPQKDNAVRELGDFLRDVALLFGIFRVLN